MPSSGSVVDALLASAAIPGLYPPMLIGDRRLVDGSIRASVPIAEAVSLGASRIYVLPTLPRQLHRPSSALVAMQHALALLSIAATQAAFALAAPHTTVLELPVPAAAGELSLFNFKATRSLIDEAYETTMRRMSTGQTGAVTGIEPRRGIIQRLLPAFVSRARPSPLPEMCAAAGVAEVA